ncbi:hypothetical protein DCS32_03360 [Dokdonia sp. Dokd-P16]|uniref:hypothetical protein n=1 Tax=Dokdonia sp. Dokd-P16 TaxID=2173169 RepID=UPI000D546CE3|nr:hypothetical protein [Dokdonia sp. Dokd-P16]AWH73235.1 hypothetical protein DCS32_03360 [Dokdonia sp. Dokd-P16]
MQFKNFGLISDTEAIKTEECYIKFLKEKKLIQNTISLGNFSLGNMSMGGNLSLKPELNQNSYGKKIATSLGLELRDYLLENYKGYVGGDLELFKMKFKRKCFGRKLTYKKKKGLSYFNKYYDNWIDISKEYNYSGLPGTDPSAPRMSNLFIERGFLGEDLVNESDIIRKYLFGERDFFNGNLLNSSKNLKQILKFENEYLILQYLNDLFGFENQKSNDRNLILDKIYKKNRTKIDSFDTILFIDYILSIEDYRSQAYGIALFDFLKHEVKTIYLSMREFSDLIVENFPSNFNKLKHRDKSDAHDEKKNLFRNEWDKFFEDH